MLEPSIHNSLHRGLVIPAHPLALDANRKLDERRQRALSRYYLAAGAGGLAVGVHTTQFAIHEPHVGLYEPVLSIAVEEMAGVTDRPIIRVAGLVGNTEQAVREAALARDLGYHAGLLSLAAMKGQSEDHLLQHCRAVAGVLPLFGFYLQPAVGGVELPYSFWRRFAEVENVVAVKVAAFDRYRTLDVVRAIAESGRTDIALYTGNDDHIVLDLLTPFRVRWAPPTNTRPGNAPPTNAPPNDRSRSATPPASTSTERRFVGGLLGHWAVWTRAAVELLEDCRSAVDRGEARMELLTRANEITDCNAAVFDTAHNYAGCVPGIHEVLRRAGLLAGTWCLDPAETLSPGQADEITRVSQSCPHLTDDAFVAEQLDEWLR